MYDDSDGCYGDIHDAPACVVASPHKYTKEMIETIRQNELDFQKCLKFDDHKKESLASIQALDLVLASLTADEQI